MQQRHTLQEFLEHSPFALRELILKITEATIDISRAVNHAGLLNILGATDNTNVHLEQVQKLDIYANDVLKDHLSRSPNCAAFASEEEDDIQMMHAGGSYVVAADPLDGSSNIDVAAPIGTIVAIHQVTAGKKVSVADFLQQGADLACSLFVLYGSSTILIITLGDGVYSFTLNTDHHTFYLTGEKLRIPPKGKIYSLNQGNFEKYASGLQQYIKWCQQEDAATSRPYALRYIGSMVGDIYRTLIKGGIFIYPLHKGEIRGKLRIIYECHPMAHIIEQAGGLASDGLQPILSLQPKELHDKTAIYIGSADTVTHCLTFLQL